MSKNKLLTKQIEKALNKSPLYLHDGSALEANVIVKFFLGRCTWYVIEGEKQEDGDWLFFGYADFSDWNSELGYFRLSVLERIKAPVRINGRIIPGLTLSVERDKYFESKPLKNFIRQ